MKSCTRVLALSLLLLLLCVGFCLSQTIDGSFPPLLFFCPPIILLRSFFGFASVQSNFAPVLLSHHHLSLSLLSSSSSSFLCLFCSFFLPITHWSSTDILFNDENGFTEFYKSLTKNNHELSKRLDDATKTTVFALTDATWEQLKQANDSFSLKKQHFEYLMADAALSLNDLGSSSLLFSSLFFFWAGFELSLSVPEKIIVVETKNSPAALGNLVAGREEPWTLCQTKNQALF